MRFYPPFRFGIALSLAAVVGFADLAPAQTKPPVAPVRAVDDTYFGQTITDPYRWLEDQKSDESKQWMKAQADYTRSVLDGLPGRKAFEAAMTRYLNAADFTITDVQVAGDFVFYRKRFRGEDQASLYVRKTGGGAERQIFKLQAMSTPGHHISLDQYTPSRDGKLVVVGLSAGGSEEQTAHVYESETGRELPDQMERFEGGGFSPDGKAVYFMELEKPGPTSSPVDKYRRPQMMRHTLGEPNDADSVILGQGVSPDIAISDYWFPVAFPSADSPYALAFIEAGVETYKPVYIGLPAALTSHKGWTKVAGIPDKVTDFALMGNDLYLVSFDGTLNGKVLRVDAAHPDLAKAEVVLPSSDLVLSGGFIGDSVLHAAKDALYIQVIDKGYGRVLRLAYGAGAKAVPVATPPGMAVDKTTTDTTVSGAVLDLTSWTSPGDFYQYGAEKKALTAMKLSPENSIDPKDLVAEEVQVKATDGTMVPLSIVYRKGLKRDGSAPTALIGYGAYGDAFTPGFSRRYNAWLERGGVLAIGHVRGGGELGEGWHLAGKLATKPHTWQDFIDSAQYLIDHHYTSSAHLGIWSQSAGGILIGRSITARPDLFAAAVDGVPASDMLRIETGPNGPTNTPEFGSVKTEDGFKALYEMSAYAHVVPGTKYPAMLVTAGANDPRVEPWQGGKMAARLEAATASGKPVLLRVNYDAGHGITDTVAQQVSDWSDIFTFFLWNFGDPQFQP
jgi:prolyl oligopeptidase